MSLDYPLVGQRLFNVPLLLRPEKAEIVCAALMDHMGITKLTKVDGTSMGVIELKQQASMTDEERRTRDQYYRVQGGVAIIPIHGSLAQRVRGLNPYSGITGYNQIEAKLQRAMQDEEVQAILLDVDSPGGEVAGCFDLSRMIYSMNRKNGGKHIVAAVNEMACSGGYALVSGADEIWATDTAIAGSIGVWTLLVDYTKALENDGIKVQMIRAGERKARGGPYEEADEATVQKLLAWVESTRQMFAQMVADHRPTMGLDAVLATEGDWFPTDEAAKLGLIDGKGPMSAIFDRARFLARTQPRGPR